MSEAMIGQEGLGWEGISFQEIHEASFDALRKGGPTGDIGNDVVRGVGLVVEERCGCI
jgi:hypothetical protein